MNYKLGCKTGQVPPASSADGSRLRMMMLGAAISPMIQMKI
ncbi:44358_t:CDS:2 [Gigaspora margarita]|uniref:44358_t:CDS:1 n=1 Tax=Gigaspora margarita TaxID=4874 RepID=A0ABN7V6C3_GIGMA|nr:44358_t:CDS:2 [Gigaspora margarita]